MGVASIVEHQIEIGVALAPWPVNEIVVVFGGRSSTKSPPTWAWPLARRGEVATDPIKLYLLNGVGFAPGRVH